MLEDDDEGELESEDLPVDGGEGSAVVTEASVVTLRLGEEVGTCLLANLFIYPARVSSLVPAGFLTAQFLQET